MKRQRLIKRKILMRASIAVTAAICLLSGCSNRIRQGTSDSEVLTLKEVPEDKLMITMRMGDGMNYGNMESAIESRFPKVDIVIRSNTAIGTSVEYQDTEDIVLMAEGNFRKADLEASFVDLSSETYVQNYYLSSLQESEVNGELYFLPGPSNIYGIVYNKDMFEEHGWEVPENLDEFIDLCREIEKTGIRAIQPALYYKDAVRQLFTGFIYQPVFSGGSNQNWLSGYRNGDTVMKGHMEPAFDIMDRLIEAGILRAEDFDIQPGTRSDMMYKDKTCAMILETQAAVEYAYKRAGENAPRLGLMPFFSGSDEDSDYFLSVPIYNMAVSKKLEEKGNEEKLKTVKEIFAYLSTTEGQKAVIGENSSVISSVKGMEYNENDFLKNAKSTIKKGHVMPQPLFVESANTEVDQVLREDLKLYSSGDIDRERFMADMDQARDQMLSDEKISGVTFIGSAEETFSILQTSCLLGEIFRNRMEAQIGLCMANTRLSGNNWKIYQGDIEYGGSETLDNYLNLSFQHKEGKNQIEGRLVKVKMTGENILKTLNTPYYQSSSFPDAYFAASGLQITFAPWEEEGKRYVSVKMADGTELDPKELYTVAFWNGTVDPALIESVEAECEDTVVDLFKEWLEDRGGSIKPDNSDFKLDWRTAGN